MMASARKNLSANRTCQRMALVTRRWRYYIAANISRCFASNFFFRAPHTQKNLLPQVDKFSFIWLNKSRFRETYWRIISIQLGLPQLYILAEDLLPAFSDSEMVANEIMFFAF